MNKINTLMAVFVFMGTSTALPAAATEKWQKIVDYDINGGQGYSETGSWRQYGPGPYAIGGYYRYLSHWEYTRQRVGIATWQTKIPYDGIYRVSISFRATENRSTDADYYVLNETGGYDHTSVNQVGHGESIWAPIWKVMGEYEYKKGQQAIVRLDGTDDGQSDGADAVKWELVKVTNNYSVATQGIIIRLLLNDGNK